MSEIEFSKHAKAMLQRRAIPEAWVWSVVRTPDQAWLGDDNNMHYGKAIAASEGRVLHVVINLNTQPNRIVTLFFDRRLGKKK